MSGQPSLDDYAESAQSLIDAVTDHAIFRIGLTGIVESWSRAAERIKGYKAAEIVGRSFALLYTEEDRAAGIPQRNLETAAKAGHFEDTAWRLRKDGSQFHAHVAIAPIRNADQRIVGFAKISRDVSARHELEAATRALATSEQLFEAQKLELMGRLTAGVAHDFNNILVAILNSLDLIAPTLPDARLHAIVKSGISATMRGRDLVSQLMACARRDSLAPQPTEVNAFVTQLQPLIQQAVGRFVGIVVSLEARSSWVEVDQAHLQSAILNIIMNAKAVTPNGGQIFLRTFDTAGRSLAALTGGRFAAPCCGLEIQDFGDGMSEAVRARSIEPFFTTKPSGQGTGLGLSQVHGFVKQSGGELEIESKVGKGTIVRLLLPACPGIAPGHPDRPSHLIGAKTPNFVVS